MSMIGFQCFDFVDRHLSASVLLHLAPNFSRSALLEARSSPVD